MAGISLTVIFLLKDEEPSRSEEQASPIAAFGAARVKVTEEELEDSRYSSQISGFLTQVNDPY